MRSQKQAALDALDKLLGCQDCTKAEKAAAIREVSLQAKRMADSIERRMGSE